MERKNETWSVAFTSTTIAVKTSLCLVLMLVGVLGNGTICVLAMRFKIIRTIPNILLTNLATVDLLNIIINVPFFISIQIYDLKTLYGKTAAWWTTFLFFLFLFLNLTSMFLLVLDRYFALAHSFKYCLWRTRRKVFFAICAAWFWAVFITGCITVPLYNVDLGAKSVFYYRLTYATTYNARYYVGPVMLTLLIPIIVLVIITVREIRKKSSLKTFENGVRKLQMNQGRKRKSCNTRSASTIMIVLFGYGICLLCTCGICFTIIALNGNVNRHSFVFSGMYSVLCGSAYTSYIYVARSSQLRNALRETFKNIKCFQNGTHHHQKETATVFYRIGYFGKQQIRINHSFFDGVQGRYTSSVHPTT